MTFYHTQLSHSEAYEFFVKEFNKAPAHFPGAEIIPAKLSILYTNEALAKMKQLFRYKGHYYLLTLDAHSEQRFTADENRGRVDVYSRHICVRQLKDIALEDAMAGMVYIGSSELREITYTGAEIYMCAKPNYAREVMGCGNILLWNDFESNAWYFMDFETPSKILQKIRIRCMNKDAWSRQSIITIRLKRTPYRGFKKNVLYKRYDNGLWTLTNKNGREVTKYELVK